MENPVHRDDPTPADCFRQEEVAVFKSFEGQTLTGVNYFLWLDIGTELSTQPYRFLFALELLFDSGETLLLSSGDDSEAIRVISAEILLETAKRLQQLHGQPTIQRVIRDGQGVWQQATGQKLASIQLSRQADGLYRNDALMLDFGAAGIVVELPEAGEGLEIREI
jgi:hypothetical protein